MKHSSLTILLLLLFVSASFGQTQTANLKPPPRRNYKYTGKIVSTFDSDKNQTIVLIQLMEVKEGQIPAFQNAYNPLPRTLDNLYMTWFFAYPGKTPETPKFVSVGFTYRAGRKELYESRVLKAKIDGEKVELGKMEQLAEVKLVRMERGQIYYTAALEMTIPYELFLRIANAKKVKMQLGELDFNFSDDHREAVRDLASRTAP